MSQKVINGNLPRAKITTHCLIDGLPLTRSNTAVPQRCGGKNINLPTELDRWRKADLDQLKQQQQANVQTDMATLFAPC